MDPAPFRPTPADRRPLLAGGLLFLLAALVSVWFVGFVVATGDRLEQQRVLALARTLAASIDGDRVARLRGVADEAGTPALDAVRDELRRARDVNPDFRFVYLMRADASGDTLVFLADAEASDSADYSAPGDAYDGPSQMLLAVWRSGQPAVEAPARDRWGYWVTALAPVRAGDGRTVAVLGMDVSAEAWLATLARYRAFALSISGLVLLLIVLFTIGLQLQRQAAATLAAVNAELAAANARLLALSATDSLTSLANRRAFDAAFEREWQRAIADGQPLSLLMCDIDDFKAYNDRHGHVAGDDRLQRVAATLADGVLAEGGRPAGVPGEGRLVARYGGEEFAVILPRTDATAARALAEQLRCQVGALELADAGPAAPGRRITISVGVSTCLPARDADLPALLRAADQALYRAKEGGRNAVAVATGAA